MNVPIGRSGRSMIGPCSTIRSSVPVAQLVMVGQARATGRAGGGAFHSAVGVGNLIALIRKLSGVSVLLEERVRLPGTN